MISNSITAELVNISTPVTESIWDKFTMNYEFFYKNIILDSNLAQSVKNNNKKSSDNENLSDNKKIFRNIFYIIPIESDKRQSSTMDINKKNDVIVV